VSENTIGAPPGQWYLTAEELADAHRFVEVRERAGYTSAAEAAAWRERIAVWQRFRLGSFGSRLAE
jgi:hypothetical protein